MRSSAPEGRGIAEWCETVKELTGVGYAAQRADQNGDE